jgi:hypothetical protein
MIWSVSGMSAWFVSIAKTGTLMVPYLGTLMQRSPDPGRRTPRFAMCDPTWLTADLTARELRVLLALSLYADWTQTGYGRCYPKRDTIALATGLEISHVSESVRTLSDVHHLISVVRFGRKNVYYVRVIGETKPMPPSNAQPFFEHLAHNGVRLNLVNGEVVYDPDTPKRLEHLTPLYKAIVSDYVRGLTSLRLADAIQANQQAKQIAPI